jgi:hypothetical protein
LVRSSGFGSVCVVVVSVSEPSALCIFFVVFTCFLPVSVVCSSVLTCALTFSSLRGVASSRVVSVLLS